MTPPQFIGPFRELKIPLSSILFWQCFRGGGQYLEEYGYVRVIRTLGTAPYDFREVNATRHTREFVNENSR